MPPQVAPPDTSSYMIAGYVVFAVIMGIYLASFFIRRRNLEQDLKTLEGIQVESHAPTAPASPIVRTAAKPRAKRPASSRPKATRKRVTRKK